MVECWMKCVPNGQMKITKPRRETERYSFAAFERTIKHPVPLEADNGTERYLKVIASAIIEVNAVTGIETKPQWTPKSFDSNSRINRRPSIPRSHAAQSAVESRCGARVTG